MPYLTVMVFVPDSKDERTTLPSGKVVNTNEATTELLRTLRQIMDRLVDEERIDSYDFRAAVPTESLRVEWVTPSAYILPDGQWHERTPHLDLEREDVTTQVMNLFYASIDTPDRSLETENISGTEESSHAPTEWELEWRQAVSDHPEHLPVFYTCHR